MPTIEDMRTFVFPIAVEEDEDGFFVECPTLSGCVSQGDTYKEAVSNIKEAIGLYIEVLKDEGREIPESTLAAGLPTVEISI